MDRPKQFRDPQLETSGEIIGFYPREFYVFDNFSSFQVDYQGRRWPTSEHAYQASHFFETAPELVEAIAEARSADQHPRGLHGAGQIGDRRAAFVLPGCLRGRAGPR